VGAALLTLIAAAAGLADHPSTAAAVALWAAIAATGAHSAATARAAPTNFRQRRLGADEAALTALFNRFQRWQTIRVSFQGLCCIWSAGGMLMPVLTGGQIAKASSANATATRRLTGSSTATS
jgi:hypothetical protein